jgi:hypothetical protein
MKTVFAFALLASCAAGSFLAPSRTWAAEGIALRASTAGELAELCGANPRSAGADAKINFCHGFAQGAIDVARQRLGDKKLFCFPSPSPSRTSTMNEFVNWARALPDHRNQSALDGLFHFLGERFPCK